MKKILLLLFLIPVFVSAQTTLEEWNYVTKGYKIQKDSGLDMKKGYELIFEKRETAGNFVCDFFGVYKSDILGKARVAIMVHSNYQGGSYFCIPKLGNKDVDVLYRQQIESLFKARIPVLELMLWHLTDSCL